ncbi:malate dehydrogenase [Amycolatopsis silviterrae]|uniref:Malate dehydrogenase n=1 Tax=Amycolatopsis silviterrae TaxID=1656914 RepID=A0ABW5HJZ5_9PSEU
MKVVIIGGAGGIGSSVAFNLLLGTATHDIVLVDTRPAMLTSHTMDLENAVALGTAPSTVRGGTPDDALDADIVVLSAAVPLRLNTSRSVFLTDNARIVGEILAPLGKSRFTGTVLVLTNPVDPLLTWVYRNEWVARERLVGYTLNDSLRLRTGIAQALRVHPLTVDAWMLGEHGEGQVPLYSRVTVDGEPATLDDEQRAAVTTYVNTWYQRHVALDSGRTSTWTTGRGAARMIDAMATESGTVFPASVVPDGEYGISEVSIGLPVVLGRTGIDHIVEWELTADEKRGMTDAAARVDSACAQLVSSTASR